MSDHRVGETGLSNSGPSSQPLAYGLHGFSPTATNFFDQEGAAYFEELEEALMQGVVGIRGDGNTKTYLTTRPPTLEIFPSWPMRFHPNAVGNSQSAESSDSGSAQNTISQLESESPVSRKDDYPELFTEKQQQQQMIPSDGSKAEIGTAENHQSRDQGKRRLTAEKDGKNLDAKTLRRLAQNREAARKSRLRKKAYVQQLESSRMKLAQLEQDLERARSQGLLLPGASTNGGISSGAVMFDMEYAQWLDENYKHMAELQGGLQSHLPDNNLRVLVDECLKHYDEIFRLKTIAVKSDVFHLITGMWTTPAERCFLWVGGFRPSDLLKILMPHVDPLTEQQLVGICNLQQSSQQAEEALSQGLEQLQQSLADTVASGSLSEDLNVGNYMGYMAMALGKIGSLEGFVRQADNLRQQTLHQLRRILTIRQAARCFLAIGEYNNRLRALSSLWSSRPRENSIANENGFPASTNLQILQPAVDAHFSVF
ncbi:transcription factor TGAL5-like [Phalaenopsis equestris]|uniref:transcription factor TGAL5-like n=1 Tax=Phalaenopsis equestris TaxID=78828 RepID=UPI0009E2108D|nr:transcription factor TGAL5-like [Phalaenopsis equestris]